MAFELSSNAEAMVEPLEQEAANGPQDEAPDKELLAELGFEVQSTTKPNETSGEAVEDAVDEIAEEPEAAKEESEEVEETEDKKEEPKGRANKRIQALVKEKKEMEARLARRDQEFQQQMQLMQQQQTQTAQQLARQNAVLHKQLELLQKGQQPVEDESKLTPMEQYERKLLRQAEARAEAKIAPRIQQMEQRLAQQEAERVAAQKRAQQQASLAEFTERAQVASKDVLMRDVDTGVFAPEDENVGADLVLSYVAATGADPKEAAQRFKMWLDKYHQGRLRKVSKTSGKSIQQSQRVPAPLQGSKGTVQGEKKPSWDVLQSHGYDNYVQWINAGSPALAKK